MRHYIAFFFALIFSFTFAFASELPEAIPETEELPVTEEAPVEPSEPVEDGEEVVEGEPVVVVPESIVTDSLTIEAGVVTLAMPENNEYPSDSPLSGGVYIEVDTRELGEVLIYVPTDYQYRSFAFDESGNIVNIRSATITGVLYDGNTVYSVRFTSFGNPSYRLATGNYTWDDLTVTEVLNTNVVFIESNEDLPPVPDADMLSVIIVALLGVIVLCHFMKRF